LQRRLELSRDQIVQLDQQTHELKRQQQSSDQFHLREKGAMQESLDAASQVVRELQSRCRLLEELQHTEATGVKERCQEYEDRIIELKRMNKEVNSRVAALEDQLRKSDLNLTSEAACNNSLRLTVETLERQLGTIQEANAHSVSTLELSLGKLQSSLSECNKQLRESELQRRVQLEKANAANKELSTMLSSTECSNHLLADEMNSMRVEVR
jgi:chromosome segregation ATPase